MGFPSGQVSTEPPLITLIDKLKKELDKLGLDGYEIGKTDVMVEAISAAKFDVEIT